MTHSVNIDGRLAVLIKGFKGAPLLAVALVLGLPSFAQAVGADSYSDHAMMGGWGWAGMIIGPLMMIAVLATIVIVVVLILRWLGGGSAAAPMDMKRPRKEALDILKERFARGEIDAEEFADKRRVLEQ